MFARFTTFAFVALALTPSSPPVVSAATPRTVESGSLTLATERVIIFKDGYGLFVKSASGVADAQGKVHTEQVPGAAVLGTFWAIPEGRALKSTIAGWYETVRAKTDEGSCLSTVELLRANEGKQVTFGLGDKDLQGKVLDVLEASAVRPKIQPGPEGTYETELPPRGGELVAIELSDKSRLVMPVASVKTLAGKDLSTHCLRPGEVATRSKRLTFDFGREAAGKTVTLKIFYFTPGVRWIPTYRVNTGASSKADLELQGEILNEEEDFENAAVDLVVGVGSFKFKGTVSPMSLEQALRAALSKAMPALTLSNYAMSNSSFDARSGERADPESASAMPLAPELAAETHQDMFVYSVKSLGLTKGARAIVPLWRHQVPQRHVYTADFGTWVAPRQNNTGLTENTVRHQLELTDDTGVPFTTGAAMVMEGGIPLGQDLLGYTSPGGKTLLPITTALNLRALQSEREVSRTQDAGICGNSRYTAVVSKGKIALANFQQGLATMRIKVSTRGKVEKASHGGQIRVEDQSCLNNQSVVTWEVTLAPGKSLDLTYDLTFHH